jgi:hypothetical protein
VKVLDLPRDQAEFEAEQKMKVPTSGRAREREVTEFKLAPGRGRSAAATSRR